VVWAATACAADGEPRDTALLTGSDDGDGGTTEVEPGNDDGGVGDDGSGESDEGGDDTTTGGPDDVSTSTDDGMPDTGGTTGVVNDCPWVEIDVGPGSTLNVRPDPSTANAPVGSLSHGAVVTVLDEVVGEDIDGNDTWYEIENPFVQGFVSAAFATCTLEEPPEINPDGWYLPLPCGMSATISQGNNGNTSHQGNSFYAFDFAVPLETPLVAIASGTVFDTFDETGPGDPCYSGGDSSCVNFANYVILQHADGTKSTYRHLNQVDVAVGDVVMVGEPVGLSGSTGWSTGRHAHVMRMEDCGGSFCQSIPLAFDDVAGDGVPVTGDNVTSGNCPG